MKIKDSHFFNIDKYILIFYVLFVFVGFFNIYSVSSSFVGLNDMSEILEFKSFFSKQIIWIVISILSILIIFIVDYRIFINSSVYVYMFSILLILGLFIFGSSVKGQTSWYKIGFLGIQPSEFSKLATSLFFSYYVSKKELDFLKTNNIIRIILIISIPLFLILMEPDVGTALTFLSFLLVLFMMGYYIYFILLVYIGLLLILGILFDKFLVFSGLIITSIIIYIISVVFGKILKDFKFFITRLLLGSLLFLGILNIFWENILKERHRNRINIVLGLLEDNKGIGYNTYQSKIAIGSGGFRGKGFKQGIYNKGNFVPEQHSDFIFCTIGEEWGFLWSMLFLLLYLLFIARLFRISNRQKSDFVRVYGYCVTSFLFVHFFINIAMVLGIMPVIGITLPFVSYGGSSLIMFTMMLFIFLRLDLYRDEKI